MLVPHNSNDRLGLVVVIYFQIAEQLTPFDIFQSNPCDCWRVDLGTPHWRYAATIATVALILTLTCVIPMIYDLSVGPTLLKPSNVMPNRDGRFEDRDLPGGNSCVRWHS